MCIYWFLCMREAGVPVYLWSGQQAGEFGRGKCDQECFIWEGGALSRAALPRCSCSCRARERLLGTYRRRDRVSHHQTSRQLGHHTSRLPRPLYTSPPPPPTLRVILAVYCITQLRHTPCAPLARGPGASSHLAHQRHHNVRAHPRIHTHLGRPSLQAADQKARSHSPRRARLIRRSPLRKA